MILPARKLHADTDLGFLRSVQADRGARYDVHMVGGGLGGLAVALLDALKHKDALLVTTPTVAELYGQQLRAVLQGMGRDLPMLVLPCREAQQQKSLEKVEDICRTAYQNGITRRGVLISFGGGTVMDLVTFAASWIRRGIKHIRLPTTLVGQVDAAVGVKGAVNFAGKKSALGCYHAPDQVFVLPLLLRTLQRGRISEGLSEIIKMAVIRDPRLFRLLEADGRALLDSGFETPADSGVEVIRRAILGMLEELEPNLYEDRTWERPVDFGHSISPALEARVGFGLHHGHAVAIDMAMCSALSAARGLMPTTELDRMLKLLHDLELPTWHEALTPELFDAAIRDCTEHRGGQPNVVLPLAMGRITIIGDAAFFDGAYEVMRRRLAA
ncbi:MAG: 2-epi-5-epi-valiolone synthase [Alphaproteobacteria bacterium]|nr:2-epi-5-epi-valiolone synthase [Alphaproteobacteria bacterium]